MFESDIAAVKKGDKAAFENVLKSFEPLILIGLILYSFIMLFQLATLPVEFNASSRAISVIEERSLLKNEEELIGAKKVLRSAALTYVASLFSSVMNNLGFFHNSTLSPPIYKGISPMISTPFSLANAFNAFHCLMNIYCVNCQNLTSSENCLITLLNTFFE